MSTKCTLFEGRTDLRSGHGVVYIGRDRRKGQSKYAFAHRLAYEAARGPIPDGLCVLHKCDVPSCVNPTHLFLGTRSDNHADMVSKGRQAKGFRLPHTKLSAAQVRAIRRTYAQFGVSQESLGKKYGITQSHVSRLLSGERGAQK